SFYIPPQRQPLNLARNGQTQTRTVNAQSKKPEKQSKTLPETPTQTQRTVNTQYKEPETHSETLPETPTQTLGTVKIQSKQPKKQPKTLPETPLKTQPVQVSQQQPPIEKAKKKPEQSTKAQNIEKRNTPIYPSVQSQPIILDKNFERVPKRHTQPFQKSPSQKSAPSKKEKQAVPLSPETPGIQIRKTVITKINTELSTGYNAFQQNDDLTAQRAYTQVLQKDKNNRDALLGLAAVALRKGHKVQAQQHYQRALHLYPQDTYAQVGLINTLDDYSPETESQLKLLLKKTPQSAYIHFSLGNFYARQGRWVQAQQSYFNAYHYDNNQADYVYNLAISLDYINQPSIALTYYQQALKLASNQSVHFNRQTVLKRMQTLNAHARVN
ncbi:tetratricopeptide repeat protein, partial [Candidatus Marithioploca araucensis]|nr:tetratricopeptide repeat protein [Candidatus Marithioploca araucensis]